MQVELTLYFDFLGSNDPEQDYEVIRLINPTQYTIDFLVSDYRALDYDLNLLGSNFITKCLDTLKAIHGELEHESSIL